MNRTDSSTASQNGWRLLFATWMTVTIATMGSLFFSEVMDVPVCELCWYQRIAMYPLVLILAMGLFPYDPRAVRTAGVLTWVGWAIALFHVLLVTGIIPENVQPCVQGIPCSETHIAILGFLNVPLLSLITFSLIGALLYFSQRMESS